MKPSFAAMPKKKKNKYAKGVLNGRGRMLTCVRARAACRHPRSLVPCLFAARTLAAYRLVSANGFSRAPYSGAEQRALYLHGSRALETWPCPAQL